MVRRQTRRTLARALTVVTVGAMVAAAGVTTAWSAGSTTTASPNGAFTSPDPATPSATASPAVAGEVRVTGCLSSIDLAVVPLDGQPNSTRTVTVKGNGKGIQDFVWPDASRPTLPYNGRYQATARAAYVTSGRAPMGTLVSTGWVYGSGFSCCDGTVRTPAQVSFGANNTAIVSFGGAANYLPDSWATTPLRIQLSNVTSVSGCPVQ